MTRMLLSCDDWCSLRNNRPEFRKALPAQLSYNFNATSGVSDGDHLVLCARLVLVMALAAQIGLPGLLADKIHIAEPGAVPSDNIRR